MASPPRFEPQADTTPKRFPEVPPPPPGYTDSVQVGWLAESMMQVQHTIGRLDATTNHLRSETSEHSRKLDRISHIIFAAGVVLTILLAVGGFILDKIWNSLVLLLASSGHS